MLTVHKTNILQPLTDADHERMQEHEHGFRRGFADGYDRALGDLCKLREAGHRDVWAMVAIAERHLRRGELRDWVRARPRVFHIVPPLLVVEPAQNRRKDVRTHQTWRYVRALRPGARYPGRAVRLTLPPPCAVKPRRAWSTCA